MPSLNLLRFTLHHLKSNSLLHPTFTTRSHFPKGLGSFVYCVLTGLLFLGLNACKPKKADSDPDLKKTRGGLEYRWLRKAAAVKAEAGDLMELRMRILSGDSVLYDGSKLGQTYWIQLTRPAYQGSIQEGLALMGPGDSACFYPVADSVFKYELTQSQPEWIARGSKLNIHVGVRSLRNEEAEIRTVMQQQGIPDSCQGSSGLVLYRVPTSVPAGSYPRTNFRAAKGLRSGTKYRLLGTLQTLSGQLLRSFTEMEPYYLVAGEGTVRPQGLNEALLQCSPGDSVWIISPSWLAYGKKGVPEIGLSPYATLFFQLRISEVEGSKMP